MERTDGANHPSVKDDGPSHGIHHGPIIFQYGPSSFGKICRKSAGSSPDAKNKVRMMDGRTGQIILQRRMMGRAMDLITAPSSYARTTTL